MPINPKDINPPPAPPAYVYGVRYDKEQPNVAYYAVQTSPSIMAYAVKSPESWTFTNLDDIDEIVKNDKLKRDGSSQ